MSGRFTIIFVGAGMAYATLWLTPRFANAITQIKLQNENTSKPAPPYSGQLTRHEMRF